MDLLWISYGFPMGFHGFLRIPMAFPMDFPSRSLTRGAFLIQPPLGRGNTGGSPGRFSQDGESKMDHLPSGDFLYLLVNDLFLIIMMVYY